MRRYQQLASPYAVRESLLRLRGQTFSQTSKRMTSASFPKVSYVNYYKIAFFGFSALTFFYQQQSSFQNSYFFTSFSKPCWEAYIGTKYRTHPFESWDALVKELVDDCDALFLLIPSEEQALLDAVYALRLGDHSAFIDYLATHDAFLKTQTFLFNALADIATTLGKVSALRALEKVNSHLIAFNPFAQRLLNHVHADEIECLSAEVVTGPGKMKIDGANALLNMFYQRDVDQVYQDFISNVLNEFGDDCKFVQHYRDYVEKMDEVRQRYSPENVVIFDDYNDGLLSDFKKQVVLLKERLSAGVDRATLSYLIAGAHFTCGQIVLDKDVNGKISGKMVVLDSLGALSGAQRHSAIYFSFYNMFDGDVTLYVSEELIQKASVGCSMIAEQQFHTMLHASHYVPGGDLFTYLEKNKTNYRDIYCVYDETYSVKGVLRINTARLPAAFCSLKQVLCDKRVEETVMRVKPEASGKEDLSGYVSYEVIQVHGQASLVSDLEQRKEEYQRPADPRDRHKTLNDKTTENLTVKSGKLVNTGVDKFAFTEGVALVRYLGLFKEGVDYREASVVETPSDSSSVNKY